MQEEAMMAALLGGARVIPTNVRDISDLVLGADGRMRVLPASFWATTTVEERAKFGHLHGQYLFPTTELVDWLKEFIGGRMAIEIGSGTGVLADALGIVGTDNRMQMWPNVKARYDAQRQPTIKYGPNVIEFDAQVAVRRYKPNVVVASWVTHKYDPKRHDAGGNQYGVVEEKVVTAVDHYVFIGNEEVHQHKSIWSRPHRIIYPEWLVSRAHNGSRDFIAIFGRKVRDGRQGQEGTGG